MPELSARQWQHACSKHHWTAAAQARSRGGSSNTRGSSVACAQLLLLLLLLCLCAARMLCLRGQKHANARTVELPLCWQQSLVPEMSEGGNAWCLRRPPSDAVPIRLRGQHT